MQLKLDANLRLVVLRYRRGPRRREIGAMVLGDGLKYGFPQRGIKPIVDPAKAKFTHGQILDNVKRISPEIVAAHAVITFDGVPRPKAKRPMRLSPLGAVLPPKPRSSPGGTPALEIPRSKSSPALPATPAPPAEVKPRRRHDR